ncbi:MAG: ABC transporter permease [Candidatus Omnitrophica bacterium]|nr:ABC transporter permease [Candidatus Omnitrophota bacterium]
MINYLIRRILILIPLFIGITLISFLVIHLAPGRPTTIASDFNPKVSLEVRARLAKLYGLDKPLHIQYRDWFLRLIRFDFGNSFLDDRPVWDKIKERVPITLLINVLSLALILIVAIPLGIKSALREGCLFDKSSTIFVFVGFAMPSFWLALLLMSLFGVHLRWLPISGIKSIDFEFLTPMMKFFDVSKHLILPVFVSAFGGLAGISRYMRQGMLEVIKADYVIAARARGLSETRVIYNHALRNALIPIITILGLSIPGLIGGSVIFETIFAIPGMGRLFFESVMSRDYPSIMGLLVLGSIFTLAGNLIADVTYAWVDPRIRYQR